MSVRSVPPADNQVGVWTGDGTIEGDSNFTFNGSTLNVVGDITLSGTVDGIDIATDVAANTAKVGVTTEISNLSEDTTPQFGGIVDTNSNQIRWSKGSDVASSTALIVGNDGNYFDITGTTAITSITTKAIGTLIKLHFDAALTLTHHATNLILPGGANITTAAGDEAEFIEYGTGTWRCINYSKATGSPIVTNIVEDTTPQFGGIVDTNSQQVRWSKGADVASAAALTLGVDGNYFDITGTTAITSIGTLAVGTVVKLHFDGILTLTHHATDLILPGGANITTAAGDETEFVEYATGDWRCTNYTKADGTAVVGGGGGGDLVDDTTPQLGGDLDTNNFSISWDPTPNSDHEANGQIATFTAGENVVFGDIVFLQTDGELWKADADAATTMPAIAMAIETITADNTGEFLFWGFARDDTWTWTVGGTIFVSTTSGTLTQTAPTATGDQVQVVGIATHADRIYFNPSLDTLEIV